MIACPIFFEDSDLIVNKLRLLHGKGVNSGTPGIDDDLTKEERETQKKLREVAREERDTKKKVKIGYRKIQINGEWFIWDEREEKLKKNV
jgi:predicted nucleotide-binding protein (sugar kinase/HSP70/actin superfamily)